MLEVDGSLPRTGLAVVGPRDLGIDDRELHLAAARLGRAGLRAWLIPRLLAFCAGRSGVAVHVAAGVRVLRPLEPLVDAATEHGLGLVARVSTTTPDDGRTPTPDDVRRAGPYLDTMVAATPCAALDAWCTGALPGALLGTARYMAPEQLKADAVDPRTDIFAIGVMLHEALTGVHPFETGSFDELRGSVLRGTPQRLADLRTDLPPELTPIVLRALARSPGDRWPSALAFQQALSRTAVDEPRDREPDSLRVPSYGAPPRRI